MPLLVRQCGISEVLNSTELLDEYASESAIDGLPLPSAKVEMYLHMESVGALHTIGAFLNDELVGYITLLSPVLPHYSVLVTVAESFFVAKKYRKTGAGLKLLHAAEKYAKELGSPGLLVSAPFGSDLAEVLPRVSYVETNRVFFRNFNNERITEH
jgi:GNAT superfamily N-acetyltransferase